MFQMKWLVQHWICFSIVVVAMLAPLRSSHANSCFAFLTSAPESSSKLQLIVKAYQRLIDEAGLDLISIDELKSMRQSQKFFHLPKLQDSSKNQIRIGLAQLERLVQHYNLDRNTLHAELISTLSKSIRLREEKGRENQASQEKRAAAAPLVLNLIKTNNTFSYVWPLLHPEHATVLSRVSLKEHLLSLLNLKTGEITSILKLPKEKIGIAKLVQSPDGSRIVLVNAGSSPKLWIWNLQINQLELEKRFTSPSPLLDVVFSEDGTRLYISTYEQETLVWTPEKGISKKTLKGNLAGQTKVGGQWIFTAEPVCQYSTSHYIRRYNAATLKFEARSKEAFESPALNFTQNPFQFLFVYREYSENPNGIHQVHSMLDAKKLEPAQHLRTVTPTAVWSEFSANNTVYFLNTPKGDDLKISVHDVQTHVEKFSVTLPKTKINHANYSVSNDGAWVVFVNDAERRMSIFEVSTGKLITEIHQGDSDDNAPVQAAFSSDKKYLTVKSGQDSRLSIYHLPTVIDEGGVK